jgi:hypothetical protein
MVFWKAETAPASVHTSGNVGCKIYPDVESSVESVGFVSPCYSLESWEWLLRVEFEEVDVKNQDLGQQRTKSSQLLES